LVALAEKEGKIQGTGSSLCDALSISGRRGTVLGSTAQEFDMPRQWFYSLFGKKFGPVPTEQIRQLAASGQLQPTDWIRRDGTLKWRLACKARGLFEPAEPVPGPESNPPTTMT
jgi:hypothetical protein